jgi:flagellar basal-body rod modification protein FlgD
MTPGVTSSTGSNQADPGQTTAAATSPSTVSKNMFLQLLVAQIKNQDPLSPADGVQFLTQLAQFTQLEQTIDMNDDLHAIREQLVPEQTSQTQS